jgi:hypothetical protein
MTVPEFIETHGDPASWSDDEYDDFLNLTTPDPTPTTTDYTPAA